MPTDWEEEPVISEAKRRGWTRKQAIAHGRALAEHENSLLAARRPDFTRTLGAERIARAEQYAAWEYDGRLSGAIGKRLGEATPSTRADDTSPRSSGAGHGAQGDPATSSDSRSREGKEHETAAPDTHFKPDPK